METQITKKDKAELKEMTELILKLEPEQRALLKNSLIVGKAIFRHIPGELKKRE